ncbi:MAG: hypothetical protein MI784_11380 [Cytophagales bacterium]|nr:hypothetical protein [Cytophagales bacterium]
MFKLPCKKRYSLKPLHGSSDIAFSQPIQGIFTDKGFQKATGRMKDGKLTEVDLELDPVDTLLYMYNKYLTEYHVLKQPKTEEEKLRQDDNLRSNWQQRWHYLIQMERLLLEWFGSNRFTSNNFLHDVKLNGVLQLLDDIHSEREKLVQIQRVKRFDFPRLASLDIELSTQGLNDQSFKQLARDLAAGFIPSRSISGRPTGNEEFETRLSSLMFMLAHYPTGLQLLQRVILIHKSGAFTFTIKEKEGDAFLLNQTGIPGFGDYIASYNFDFPQKQAPSQNYVLSSKEEPPKKRKKERTKKFMTYAAPELHLAQVLSQIINANEAIHGRGRQSEQPQLDLSLDNQLRQEMGLPPRISQDTYVREQDEFVDIFVPEKKESQVGGLRETPPFALKELQIITGQLAALDLQEQASRDKLKEEETAREIAVRNKREPQSVRKSMAPLIQTPDQAREEFHEKPALYMPGLEHISRPFQGLLGSVYFMDGKWDQKWVLKLINSETWASLGERETFASNLIRLLGQRVTAPASRPIHRTSDEAKAVFSKINEKANEDPAAEQFMASLYRFDKSETEHSVLMERVPGHTFGSGAIWPNIKSWLKDSDILFSIGEIACYDFLLGNFDRFFFDGFNVGNLMLDPKSMQVSAIDQQSNLWGMLLIAQLLAKESQKTSRKWDDVMELEKDPVANEQILDSICEEIITLSREAVDKFVIGFLNGQAGKLIVARAVSTMTNRHKHIFGNVEPMDVGFMEGLLNLTDQVHLTYMIENMEFAGFSREIKTMIRNWRSIAQTVNNFGRPAIEAKIVHYRIKWNASPIPEGYIAAKSAMKKKTQAIW